MPLLEKIVSGGQTGADRAAFDWAIENGIPHGGWRPKGRMAEDGPIKVEVVVEELPQEQAPIFLSQSRYLLPQSKFRY